MIKFRGEHQGRAMVGFILLEENIKRLKEGFPVYVFGAEIGVPFDVMIDYSEDHDTAMKKVQPALHEGTTIHDTRKVKRE